MSGSGPGRKMRSGRADGSPVVPWSAKAVTEHAAPSAVPRNPNSRWGTSPHLQGRVMEQVFIGIDVAKDRLDVHVRPTDEAFTAARDSDGLATLVARLGALAPALVVLEATGGFEV